MPVVIDAFGVEEHGSREDRRIGELVIAGNVIVQVQRAVCRDREHHGKCDLRLTSERREVTWRRSRLLAN